MAFFRQRLRVVPYIDTDAMLEKAKATLAAFQVPPEYIKYRLPMVMQASVSQDHSLKGKTCLKFKMVADFEVATVISTRVLRGATGITNLTLRHALKTQINLDAEVSANLAQGHALSHAYTLRMDLTDMTVDSVLVSDNALAFTLSDNLTVKSPLCMRYRMAGVLPSALSVGTPLDNAHTVPLTLKGTETQGHSLATRFDIALFEKDGLHTGATLRSRYDLVLQTQAHFSVSHVLHNEIRTAFSFNNGLTIAHKLAQPFKLGMSLKNNVRQGIPLVTKASVGLAVKANLSVDTSLRTATKLQTFMKAVLQQGHAIKITHSLGMNARSALTVGARLKSSTTLALYTYAKTNQSSILRSVFDMQFPTAARLIAAAPISARFNLPVRTRANLLSWHPVKSLFSLPLKSLANQAPSNAYEDETHAFLLRMLPIPSTVAKRDRINLYIKNLKTAGVWSRLDFLYVLNADTPANARLNWVSAKYPLSVVGSPVFTAKKGYTFSVANSYLETGFVPGVSTLYVQDDSHFSVRVLNSVDSPAIDIGNANTFSNSRTALSNLTFALNSGVSSLNLLNTASGPNLLVVSRSAPLTIDYYSIIGGPTTVLNTSQAPAASSFTIGGKTTASNRQIAFASAGKSLTQSQATALISETESLLSALAAL